MLVERIMAAADLLVRGVPAHGDRVVPHGVGGRLVDEGLLPRVEADCDLRLDARGYCRGDGDVGCAGHAGDGEDRDAEHFSRGNERRATRRLLTNEWRWPGVTDDEARGRATFALLAGREKEKPSREGSGGGDLGDGKVVCFGGSASWFFAV
ncbi:hypothetical protein K456DRAFT_746160 [Colletotrichum gloeosporioides 23]|nr:hypothetical protein K456DRAFT_746160 [Colletotrichum gloeosporioides 23]